MSARDADARASIAARLIELGARAVQEEGHTLLTFFPDGTELGAIRRAVRTVWPAASWEAAFAGDVSASIGRHAQVGVQRLGRIAIAPPWLAHELDSHDGAVIVDPAMAFGTGEHPTTRGVVRLMQAVIRPGDAVADLGAGSAVLSIAAAKLGAWRVAAIEIDPDAIGNAEANVERNGVRERVIVIEGDAAFILPHVAPVRVVLANLSSSALVGLLPTIARALLPGGRAIVSGVMATERDMMRRTLGASQWTVEAEDLEAQWWSATLARTS